MKNRVRDDETILILLIPVMTALGLVSIFYFAFSLAQLSESNSLTQSPSTSTIAPSPHSSATTPSTTDQP